MTDSEFPPPQSHAGRRWIAGWAGRLLADATGICCEIGRRPVRPTAGGRRCPARRTTTTVDSKSII